MSDNENRQLDPERVKFAQEVLEKYVKDMTIMANLYAEKDDDVLWSDTAEMDMAREELLGSICDELGGQMPEVFEGLPLQEFDEMEVWEMLADLATQEAELDDEYCDDDEVECYGDCNQVNAYTRAWAVVLNKIMDGSITRENVERWMGYFEDVENLETEICAWVEEEGK